MKSIPESKDRKSFDRHFFLIPLIFALALFLRLWGISWGLPNSLHQFSYHPDELPLLSAALRIDPAAGQFNPAFYNYPSFYIYMTSFSTLLASAWGVVSSIRDMYLAARIIVVLMGAGSVFLVYFAGRRWYGKSAGLVAALIMAVLPLSVVHSHYATVDVPAAFWVAACIAAASALTRESRAGAYLVAGLMAGFAAGTKYNAAIVVIVPILAHFMQARGTVKEKVLCLRLWLVPLAAVAGFLITTPGVLLWHEDFMKNFSYEIWHASSGHGFVFVNTGPGWLFTFTSSFLHGFGVPLAVFTVIAVIFALVKREKADWSLLAFFVCYYLLISSSQVRFTRYAMPLVPVAVLLIGRMLTVRVADKSGYLKALCHFFGALLVLHTLLYCITLDSLFTGPNSRESALNWFADDKRKDKRIGLASVPWFYTPPFADGFGNLRVEDCLKSAYKSSYRLVVSVQDWDSWVLAEQPDYVVVSDFESLDAIRAGDESAISFLHRLEDEYALEATFGDSWLWNINLVSRKPQDLPHDMKYMNPTIWVYKRK